MMNVMMWIVVRLLCKNVILGLCCFFELIVVDDDYDDDSLMVMNSYMQNVDVIDDECMCENEDENDDDLLLNVCIIESYVHAFISMIFIFNEDD